MSNEKVRLKNRVEKAMTVEQLKAALDGFDDNQPIFFEFNSGDFWHSMVLSRVDEVDEDHLAWSSYHECPERKKGNEEEVEGLPMAVILC